MEVEPYSIIAIDGNRIKHLNEFVQGYGKFAKLPTPQLITINWTNLIEQLKNQWQVNVTLNDDVSTQADHTQLEQLLINLLKNAHESGSTPEDVSLTVQQETSAIVSHPEGSSSMS